MSKKLTTNDSQIDLRGNKRKLGWLWPGNWISIFGHFSFKEKLAVFVLILIIVSSAVYWSLNGYSSVTDPIPDEGGQYIEGLVGQPVYINPIFSSTNEADSDLVKLIYSSLFKYDKNGKLIPDLAEKYEISEDKKEYVVYLKKDIKWHDGETLDASDVYFTLKAIQDPVYKSPLRHSWQGVEMSQLDDYTLKFKLKQSYFGFLDNLTVGILPKHVWENITADKFTLADYNLNPVGTGPYKSVDFQKDSNGNILSYQLAAFENYFLQKPYLSEIIFNFYPSEEAVIEAYNNKEIMGLRDLSPNKFKQIENKDFINFYENYVPRYFAVFFNQNNSVSLAFDEVRLALSCSVNRGELIAEVLGGKGSEVYAPFLSQMEEYYGDQGCNFDLGKANQILDEKGWEKQEDGVRKKEETVLEFELVTVDWPDLIRTADLLKIQWEQIGVRANVHVLSISDMQQNYIRPREYDSLLFGQAISFSPDPYSFWHSSQKKDPGLNLSLLDDKNTDKLLEEAREEVDKNQRIEKYREFQKIVREQNPAVFLYSPHYIYAVSDKVQGIEIEKLNDPSWRFADINQWYMKTKRMKK